MVDPAERATRAYYEERRRQAAAVDSGFIREYEGVLVAARGTATADGNYAVVTRPLGDPDGAVQAVKELFHRRELPFRVILRDGLDPGTERALAKLGFEVVDRYPELIRDLPGAITQEETTPPLEIRRVEDESARKAFVGVLADAFGGERDYFDAAIPTRAAEAGARFFLGFRDDQPVATSAIYLGDGVAGIWFVATLEAFRRRGIGETMTEHALREATREGCDLAHLEAEGEARRLYERVGFKVVARYADYEAD